MRGLIGRPDTWGSKRTVAAPAPVWAPGWQAADASTAARATMADLVMRATRTLGPTRRRGEWAIPGIASRASLDSGRLPTKPRDSGWDVQLACPIPTRLAS